MQLALEQEGLPLGDGTASPCHLGQRPGQLAEVEPDLTVDDDRRHATDQRAPDEWRVLPERPQRRGVGRPWRTWVDDHEIVRRHVDPEHARGTDRERVDDALPGPPAGSDT